MQLASEIVAIFHGDPAAAAAADHFRSVFQDRDLPAEMPEVVLLMPTPLQDILTHTGLATSKSEVRRLVQQGGIRLDGEKVSDADLVIVPAGVRILQIGRRKFLRLRPS
jgi:tyrosyl-tRNA synthetase